MSDPSLTITISRDLVDGAPDPLVFSGVVDSNIFGVTGYQAPAYQQRVTYTPDSQDRHGSVALGSVLQQALLSFNWMRDAAASEAEVQAARDDVRAALAQIAYTVTTQISGAAAEVWAADPGSLTPPARSFQNLADPGVCEFVVSIPVYPIAGV